MIKENYYIKQIDNGLAIKIVIENHYLHRRPPCIISYGLFLKESNELKGVIIYGQVVSDTLASHLCGPENKTNIYELTRLWVHDSVPKNGESFLIGNTIRLLDREIVVSFADNAQNHVGSIYQATNFVYTGLSVPGRDLKIKGQNKNKSSLKLEDTVENIKLKYGEENVYYETRSRKHRYVYFNCNQKRKKQLLERLKYKTQPYPKPHGDNIIYGLKDPETKEIRYIGKSTNGLRRPKQHRLRYSLIGDTHKNHWIKSLLTRHLMYEIEILEGNIPPDKLDAKEVYWISHFKVLGVKLTNGTDGGEGALGRKAKDSTKEIIAEKRRKWFKEVGPTQLMLENCYKRKDHVFINEIEHKHCWKCEKLKPLIDFGLAENRWDKKNPQCKECHNAIVAEYRTENIEKLTQDQWKQSYVDRKEAMSAGLKETYRNNPELRKQNAVKASKPILQLDLNGRVIKEFSSALEAKKAGFQNSNLGQAIKYKKPYRGFMWKFKVSE